MRADERIVSVEYSYYDPFYGAHGNDSYGVTFDTATGTELTLSDIVVDVAGFNATVNNKIDSYYSNAVWEPGADHVSRYDPNDSSSYRFTVGNEGVTVYFESLDFLGVELGEPVIITVTYSENPALFNDNYFNNVGDYIEWWDGQPVCLDFNGDGVCEDLSIEFFIDERELRLYCGQQTITDYQEGLELLGQYIVRRNGIYYVYSHMMMENDYEFIEVFDTNNMTFLGSDMEVSPGYLWDGEVHHKMCLTDPDRMQFFSRMGLISNFYTGYRFYRIGEDGYPEAIDSVFMCNSFYPIRTEVEISCDLVNENGEVIGQTTIPAGTYLVHVRSGGGSYVDFQQVDESEIEIDNYGNGYYSFYMHNSHAIDYNSDIFRLYVEGSSWPRMVNGIAEDTLFSGVQYGG